MRRSLPLLIIVAVLCLATAGGWSLLRWKRQHQPSQTSVIEEDAPLRSATPIVPVVPESTETPGPSETPSPSEPESSPAPVTTATAVPETRVSSTPEPVHIRGSNSAKVTLEEFGDFQCAPCGRLYPVLRLLEQDYGDRLRVYFRHMPLTKHEHAILAAHAAEAAGMQGRFWEMHDLLFENSARWIKGVDTVEPEPAPLRRLESNILAMDIEVRDVFSRYAEILKLDVDRFKQDLDSALVKTRVESDRARGLKLGIDRTPTIYVNSNLIPAPSSLTPEGLRAAIDAALAGKVFVPPPTPKPATATPAAK